jgi:hypothetical protein
MSTSDFDIIKNLPLSSREPSENDRIIMNVFLSPVTSSTPTSSKTKAHDNVTVSSYREPSSLLNKVTPSIKITLLNVLVLSTLLFGRSFICSNTQKSQKFVMNLCLVFVFALVSLFANYFIFFSK